MTIFIEGSGSHNGHVYNRGSPYDYDNFANLTGDSSWNYWNMLSHYKRMEHFDGSYGVGLGRNVSGQLRVLNDYISSRNARSKLN